MKQLLIKPQAGFTEGDKLIGKIMMVFGKTHYQATTWWLSNCRAHSSAQIKLYINQLYNNMLQYNRFIKTSDLNNVMHIRYTAYCREFYSLFYGFTAEEALKEIKKICPTYVQHSISSSQKGRVVPSMSRALNITEEQATQILKNIAENEKQMANNETIKTA